MKDYLRQIIAQQPDALRKRSIVREYLQARILQALQDNGAFLNLAFLGGTALRFLYFLPRFSEDLDFSLISASRGHRFREWLQKIKSGFEAEGYSLSIKANDKKAVCWAFLRYEGLLYELGLSRQPREMLSIKLEVDTNPPKGAGTARTIIRRYVTVNLLHYDQPSLLAGELHAILSRKYTKGRDLYDLVWYLADRTWPAPNFSLLNSALEQTGWKGGQLTPQNWRSILRDHLSHLRWDLVAEDALPFLERAEEVALLTGENCLTLLD